MKRTIQPDLSVILNSILPRLSDFEKKNGFATRDILEKLDEEVAELKEANFALQTIESGAYSIEVYTRLQQEKREAIAQEAADVMLVALRALKWAAGDPWGTFVERFLDVESRVYRKGEPKKVSFDDPSMIGRPSFVIGVIDIKGNLSFIAQPNKDPGAAGHFTENKDFAFRFASSHESMLYAKSVRLIGPDGKDEGILSTSPGFFIEPFSRGAK